jgi:hypothetical protein
MSTSSNSTMKSNTAAPTNMNANKK